MGSRMTGSSYSTYQQKQKVKTGFKGWIRIKLKLDPPQKTYQYQNNNMSLQTNAQDTYEEVLKHLDNILNLSKEVSKLAKEAEKKS